MTTNELNGLTPGKTTADTTTFAAIDLDRLNALEQWLEAGVRRGNKYTQRMTNVKGPACDIQRSQDDVRRKQQWAESVRRAIEREKPPAWKAATEKAFAQLTLLEENWDSYGGKPIDPDHIGAARFVLDQIMSRDTPPPHVTPMSNGSVQLEWCRDGVDLEIEICSVETLEGKRMRYCQVLLDDREQPYSLEDIDALWGTLARMR